MNLDSKIVQKTLQSFLTDVTPKVLTSPDISSVASLTGDYSINKRKHEGDDKSSIKKNMNN